MGLHRAFFRGFWVLSRGIWAHFLPGVWRGIWELSANSFLTAGRVFSSGYLGGAWVCPNPWPWEPAWSPSRETLLHTQAVSPDTGLASRQRGVSDRHFLGTRTSTRWAEANLRASETRGGMGPESYVRGLSTWFHRQGRLRDRRPPLGVDEHRHVLTLWEKRTHGTP